MTHHGARRTLSIQERGGALETTSVSDRAVTPGTRGAINLFSVMAVVAFISFSAWGFSAGDSGLTTGRDVGALAVLVLGAVLILARKPGTLVPASPTQFLGLGLLGGLSVSSIGADGPWFMLATPLVVAFGVGYLAERFSQRYIIDHSAD